MNPLQLMNNDMATLMMGSQKIFEHWNDTVAERMNTGCIENIRRDWNAYMDEMNTRMGIYMRAKQRMQEAMENYRNSKDKF